MIVRALDGRDPIHPDVQLAVPGVAVELVARERFLTVPLDEALEVPVLGGELALEADVVDPEPGGRRLELDPIDPIPAEGDLPDRVVPDGDLGPDVVRSPSAS
ncbi:MAG: hypothetical protein R3E12_17670 [Candidatus Eisenbacteria bacterium]